MMPEAHATLPGQYIIAKLFHEEIGPFQNKLAHLRHKL
jgi:hypothetical protein